MDTLAMSSSRCETTNRAAARRVDLRKSGAHYPCGGGLDHWEICVGELCTDGSF
jgi:hypothetical protein